MMKTQYLDREFKRNPSGKIEDDKLTDQEDIVDFLEEFVKLHYFLQAIAAVNHNVAVTSQFLIAEIEKHVIKQLDAIVTDGHAMINLSRGIELSSEEEMDEDKPKDKTAKFRDNIKRLMKVIRIASDYNISEFLAHKSILAILEAHGMGTIGDKPGDVLRSIFVYIFYPIIYFNKTWKKQYLGNAIISQVLPIYGILCIIPIMIYYCYLTVDQRFDEDSILKQLKINLETQKTLLIWTIFIWWLAFITKEMLQFYNNSSTFNRNDPFADFEPQEQYELVRKETETAHYHPRKKVDRENLHILFKLLRKKLMDKGLDEIDDDIENRILDGDSSIHKLVKIDDIPDNKKQYFTNFWNQNDWVIMICCFFFLLSHFSKFIFNCAATPTNCDSMLLSDDYLEKLFFSIALLCLIFRGLEHLGQFATFTGPFIRAFENIFQVILIFIFLIIIISLGCAFSLSNFLCKRPTPDQYVYLNNSFCGPDCHKQTLMQPSLINKTKEVQAEPEFIGSEFYSKFQNTETKFGLVTKKLDHFKFCETVIPEMEKITDDPELYDYYKCSSRIFKHYLVQPFGCTIGKACDYPYFVDQRFDIVYLFCYGERVNIMIRFVHMFFFTTIILALMKGVLIKYLMGTRKEETSSLLIHRTKVYVQGVIRSTGFIVKGYVDFVFFYGF